MTLLPIPSLKPLRGAIARTSGSGRNSPFPIDYANVDRLFFRTQRRGGRRRQQDLANIEFVATTYAAQVRACYERSIRGLGGGSQRRVVVLFSLTDDGKAQQPVISEDSLGLPVLGPCLTQRLSEWRFPRPVVGPIRTFRFPFVFAGSRP